MLAKDRRSTKKDKKLASTTVEIFEHIDEIREEWDAFGPDNVFLKSAYLSTVEKFPPRGLIPFYAFLRDETGDLIGKVYFQNKRFNGQDSLTVEKEGRCPSFFSALGFYLREMVKNSVEFKALGVGNLMVSGQHAFVFREGTTKEEEHYLVDLAIQKMTDLLAASGSQPSVILMKDFYEEQPFSHASAIGPKFYKFQVQPNMLLPIRPEWTNMEAYLADMTSKYRTRYKRARKKLDNITRHIMSYDEVVANKELMFELYQNIANGAGFNLFVLSPEYIPELKRVLDGDVKIMGYYMEGRLVGYSTLVRNGKEVEAHFLGFDNNLNASHQLYLNMLYDMVEVAIDNDLELLNYSRTALEIKSSVGAEPVQLNCYIRHQKSFQNHLLPKLFDFLKPEEEWVQRKPFKD